LDLVVVLVIDNRALVIASATECPTNIDRRVRIECILAVALAQVLKMRFIDDLRSINLGVADLEGILSGDLVISLGWQVELPHTIVVLSITKVLIAGSQRIVLRDCIIKARTDIRAMTRIRKRLDRWERIELVVKNRGIHRCGVVDVAALRINKEGRRLAEWAAQISAVLGGIVPRSLSSKAVVRIKRRVV